ncbi:hypothetical protein [Altererythrobacter sp. Z27]|uniref:hypothetical protein n=1 Tax=Altererythrobacter sp. Z27 TaxID=3461147 RepID=UPI004044151D
MLPALRTPRALAAESRKIQPDLRNFSSAGIFPLDGPEQIGNYMLEQTWYIAIAGSHKVNAVALNRGDRTMLSYLLIALFLVAAIAAAVSLADSALRFRHAWKAAQRELANVRNVPVGVSAGAVVMLRPVAPVNQRMRAAALAAAA